MSPFSQWIEFLSSVLPLSSLSVIGLYFGLPLCLPPVLSLGNRLLVDSCCFDSSLASHCLPSVSPGEEASLALLLTLAAEVGNVGGKGRRLTVGGRASQFPAGTSTLQISQKTLTKESEAHGSGDKAIMNKTDFLGKTEASGSLVHRPVVHTNEQKCFCSC